LSALSPTLPVCLAILRHGPPPGEILFVTIDPMIGIPETEAL
jgi:hypothetical protein